MSSASRAVHTYVRSGSSCGLRPIKAPFSRCLLGALGAQGHQVEVSCELSDNKLILSTRDDEAEEGRPKKDTVTLKHFEACPAMLLSDPERSKIPQEHVHRHVGAAVAVMLESSDGKVLLTRRARTMRTFPGVWVPPGGSVDWGEVGLLEAGLRELREEVNLNLEEGHLHQAKPLCLWESVFPTTLLDGTPSRQHAVVYYHVQVANKTSEELQADIVLNTDEADASAWFDQSLAELSVNLQKPPPADDVKGGHSVPPPAFTIYEALAADDGRCRASSRSSDMLQLRVGGQVRSDMERLSSGTIFALEQWLKSKGNSS